MKSLNYTLNYNGGEKDEDAGGDIGSGKGW